MLEGQSSNGETLSPDADLSSLGAAPPAPGRHEVRYPVRGKAEIVVKEDGSTFRGLVLNISASGCCVQMLAQTAPPSGALVELHLILKGKVLLISAEATCSRPADGNGFHFLEMSEDMRGNLCAVIAILRPKAKVNPRKDWQDAVTP